MHDNGPNIAARSDDEIHVLTVGGVYALSQDGGRTWRRETVPLPPGMQLKNPALAIDKIGNAHVAFTGTVRNAKEWSSTKPNHGYWELRYVRRTAAGSWEDAQNVLAANRQWSDSDRDWDILTDWPHIAVESGGTIHIAWHGTAGTHIFGRDEAFYIRRPATGANSWGPWSEPRSLHPVNSAKKEYHSFAPSIALSERDEAALTVVFYDTTDGE